MTPEEKVKLVWPLACISSRAHGTMQGVWSDPDPMADFLGASWEEVATYDRVVAAAHVVDTFNGAPSVLPPWTSSPEVNKKLVEKSEALADGELEQSKSYQANYEHATRLDREDAEAIRLRAEGAINALDVAGVRIRELEAEVEQTKRLLRTEGAVRNHWETRCMMMARDYPYSKWQKVSDGVPLSKKSVLVWCPERKNTYCAAYCGNHWEYFGGCGHEITEEVTHWMPKPEPPAEMPSCQPLPDKTFTHADNCQGADSTYYRVNPDGTLTDLKGNVDVGQVDALHKQED